MIVVMHAVAIGLAIYSGLLPWRGILEGVAAFTLIPELVSLQASLKRIGLDLVPVVIAATGLYVVLFQRLSAGILHIPKIRLSYSQPALWRAGKCFEELRQLVHWFKDYTASAALEDLEVTVSLAITQHIKEYEEHYTELVGAGTAAAGVCSKYYSGFLVLTISSLYFVLSAHPRRGMIVPTGLLVAALISRCAWELQIERVVAGRLRFVIDCAIVAGLKRKENVGGQIARPDQEETEERQMAEFDRMAGELKLAGELVKVTKPYLPYGQLWLIHYVRRIRLFANVGSLSFIENEPFRDWLMHLLDKEAEKRTKARALANDKRLFYQDRDELRIYLLDSIHRPPESLPRDPSAPMLSLRKWLAARR